MLDSGSRVRSEHVGIQLFKEKARASRWSAGYFIAFLSAILGNTRFKTFRRLADGVGKNIGRLCAHDGVFLVDDETGHAAHTNAAGRIYLLANFRLVG